MKIRLLDKDEDALAFRDIQIEAIRDMPEAFGETLEEALSKPDSEFQSKLSDRGNGDFVIGAFEKDRLVGVVGFHRHPLTNSSHKGYIWGVYVRPDFRRRGIAMALFKKIIHKAKESRDIHLLNLKVLTKNEGAIALYEDLGFSIFGTEPNSINFDGKAYDEHCMQLVI